MTDELKFIPGKQYPFASPFVDVQKDICMAFGFTISSGCGTVYRPRKAAPKHQSALLTIRGTEPQINLLCSSEYMYPAALSLDSSAVLSS